MSEPKGPPAGMDGSGAAKKASKKASRDAAPLSTTSTVPQPATSQLSAGPTVAASASPVPMLHDVPRIPLSEPKAADGDGTERKARSSKKRTSTPPDGTSGPVLTGDAPNIEAAANAKSDIDAEKERARREAKKQRAREAEEQKRREDLEREALEEARRQREQRERERRRQEELSALNANAEECQEDERNGYDDDGFENYDDDFEAPDDTAAPPPPKPAAKQVTPVQAKPQAKAKGVPRDSNVDTNELKKIQQALQAESKELSNSRPSSSSTGSASHPTPTSSTPQAKGVRSSSSSSTSIASSIAGLKQSLDPRARRVKDILDARKLEVEKFNLFQQPPLSELEKYMNHLRRGHVRQAFVQTNEGAKSMATQTKPPPMQDQSMHFPDDIGLDTQSGSATRRAGAKRNKAARGNQTEDAEDGGDNQEEEDEGLNDDTVGSTSSVRFFKFLEQAAHVVEVLVEENTQEGALLSSTQSQQKRIVQLTSDSVLSAQQLFPTKRLDQPALEKLLQDRSLVALAFSPAVSNVLVTSYGPPHRTDTEPTSNQWSEKSITCVWDVNQLDEAQYVLKHEGRVTTCCLGPYRELFVIVGTEDGSLHVWDLRSRLAIAGATRVGSGATNDIVDMYAPTYSTCGLDRKATNGTTHNSAIVALEVLGASQDQSGEFGATFQFCSLDDRGILMIWSIVEFRAGDDALLVDKCVEIGGRVKLVMNTVLDTQQQFLTLTRPRPVPLTRRNSGTTTTTTDKTSQANAAQLVTPVGPIATTMAFFPRDPQQFVVGTTTGLVLHGYRFDKPSNMAAKAYRRDRSGATASGVVCIAFHSFDAEYFLVGYEDGAIALFHGSIATALCVWEEVDFGQSVSSLQWSPSRPGVFYATYSHGLMLVWDLTVQTVGPVVSHKLKTVAKQEAELHPAALYPISLSSERMRTSRAAIAMRAGGDDPFQFQIHALGTEFTRIPCSTNEEEHNVSRILTSIL